MKWIFAIAVSLACVASAGLSAVHAKPIACSAAEPAHLQKHWSYRMIDGRKCWYEGRNMLSKSELSWSGLPASPPVETVTVAPAENSRTDNPRADNAQADNSQADRAPGEAVTGFESRWRARFLDAMGKY